MINEYISVSIEWVSKRHKGRETQALSGFEFKAILPRQPLKQASGSETLKTICKVNKIIGSVALRDTSVCVCVWTSPYMSNKAIIKEHHGLSTATF